MARLLRLRGLRRALEAFLERMVRRDVAGDRDDLAGRRLRSLPRVPKGKRARLRARAHDGARAQLDEARAGAADDERLLAEIGGADERVLQLVAVGGVDEIDRLLALDVAVAEKPPARGRRIEHEAARGEAQDRIAGILGEEAVGGLALGGKGGGVAVHALNFGGENTGIGERTHERERLKARAPRRRERELRESARARQQPQDADRRAAGEDRQHENARPAASAPPRRERGSAR